MEPRSGLVGDAGRMVVIVSVMSEEQVEVALARIYETIEPQMGIVTLSDVEVLQGRSGSRSGSPPILDSASTFSAIAAPEPSDELRTPSHRPGPAKV